MSFLDKLFSKAEEKVELKEAVGLFEQESMEKLICSQNLVRIKEKIDSSNFQEADEEGFLPLYYATLHAKIEVLEYLFSLGSDFEEASSSFVSTAFSTILRSKSVRVLECFLKHGYLLPLNEQEEPVLNLAIRLKLELAFIKLLVEQGADLESFEGRSVLEEAVLNNSSKELVLFLAKQLTVLDNALKLLERLLYSTYAPVNKQELLVFLVKRFSIDVNEPLAGESLLKKALLAKESAFVQGLIFLGAEYKEELLSITRLFTTKELQTLVEHIEQSHGDISQVLALLSFESIEGFIQTQSSLENSFVVEQVCLNERLKNAQKIALIEKACTKGANIDACEHHEFNVLYLLTKDVSPNSSLELISFLLSKGAKLEYQGYSALFFAVSNYHLALVELLLKHKANPNFIGNNKEGLANYFYKKASNLNSVPKRKEVLALVQGFGFDVNLKVDYSQNLTRGAGELFSLACISLLEKELRFFEFMLEHKGIHLYDDALIYHGLQHVKHDEYLKRIVSINPHFKRKDYYELEGKKEDANILQIALEYCDEAFIEYLLDSYPHLELDAKLKPVLLPLLEQNTYSLSFLQRLIRHSKELNRYFCFNTQHEPYEATLLHELARLANEVKENERYFKLLRILLQEGADVLACVKRKKLEYAIFVHARSDNMLNKALFELFYEYGARLCQPIGAFQESSLHTLVQRFEQKDEVVLATLEYAFSKEEVELEQKNTLKATLLLAASANCLPESLRFLINKGADVNAVGDFDNAPALHKAISNYEEIDLNKRLQTVKVLLEAGAKPEVFNKDDMNALMCAASVGAEQVLKALLEAGARVNAVNTTFESALHYAVLGKESYDLSYRHGSVKSKIIEHLAKAGAELNKSISGGATAFIYAIHNGYREIFDTFLAVGIDVNAPCAKGRSPLFYAVLMRDTYFINTLLKHEKIALNRLDEEGQNILHQLLGVQLSHTDFEEIVTQLVEQGCNINEASKTEPLLLMYVKLMRFSSEREVGFITKAKTVDPHEQRRAKFLVRVGANVHLCLERAKEQAEAKDVLWYLETLLGSDDG